MKCVPDQRRKDAHRSDEIRIAGRHDSRVDPVDLRGFELNHEPQGVGKTIQRLHPRFRFSQLLFESRHCIPPGIEVLRVPFPPTRRGSAEAEQFSMVLLLTGEGCEESLGRVELAEAAGERFVDSRGAQLQPNAPLHELRHLLGWSLQHGRLGQE